jgi:hypothetical protein
VTRTLLAFALVGFLGASASAHHSFAAIYLERESVTLEGDVTQLEYRAPHAWLSFTARDPAGELRTYRAEWQNPTRLAQVGVTKDTFRAGDHVFVTGSPARDPSTYTMHLKGIFRPADGFRIPRRPR